MQLSINLLLRNGPVVYRRRGVFVEEAMGQCPMDYKYRLRYCWLPEGKVVLHWRSTMLFLF
jgi:hypothetical protein